MNRKTRTGSHNRSESVRTTKEVCGQWFMLPGRRLLSLSGSRVEVCRCGDIAYASVSHIEVEEFPSREVAQIIVEGKIFVDIANIVQIRDVLRHIGPRFARHPCVCLYDCFAPWITRLEIGRWNGSCAYGLLIVGRGLEEDSDGESSDL